MSSRGHPNAPRHPPIYGLMAEFADANGLITACRGAYRAGYRRMDAYTPYPIHDVAESIGFHRNFMPLLVLCGGLAGLIGGFSLEYWVSVVAYPLNVGGKPAFSLPAFIPVMFECTVLGAALTAVLGMLALNGLPMPYHPVFNVPRFALASRDRFFLCIESSDPHFDREATKRFLEGFSPSSIAEVEH
jgi:hypothetical protein